MSLIADMARAARLALPTLAAAPTAQKALAIRTAADAIRARSEELLSANAADVAAAKAAGMSPALVDRLALDAGRVTAVAGGVAAVAGLADPVGAVIARWSQPNGLQFERVRVPLGVIGIIYESRPGVTADAAQVNVISHNSECTGIALACVLRIGC